MRRLLLLVPLFVVGCGSSTGRVTPQTETTPDLDFPVGAFALTERSGATVTNETLRGKVWVASFVFTRCTGPCPQVTATVAKLQAELADQPDVRFVTFTVDPARDDPNELKKYAENYRADPARWLFLTGDEATIHKLLHERFKQSTVKKTGSDVKPGDEFDHSTRLVVVDKKGVMRATFEGMPKANFPDADARFADNLTRLKDKVAALTREP